MMRIHDGAPYWLAADEQEFTSMLKRCTQQRLLSGVGGRDGGGGLLSGLGGGRLVSFQSEDSLASGVSGATSGDTDSRDGGDRRHDPTWDHKAPRGHGGQGGHGGGSAQDWGQQKALPGGFRGRGPVDLESRSASRRTHNSQQGDGANSHNWRENVANEWMDMSEVVAKVDTGNHRRRRRRHSKKKKKGGRRRRRAKAKVVDANEPGLLPPIERSKSVPPRLHVFDTDPKPQRLPRLSSAANNTQQAAAVEMEAEFALAERKLEAKQKRERKREQRRRRERRVAERALARDLNDMRAPPSGAALLHRKQQLEKSQHPRATNKGKGSSSSHVAVSLGAGPSMGKKTRLFAPFIYKTAIIFIKTGSGQT